MADVDTDDPGDSDVVSAFPANERASRAAILALLSGDAFGGGDMGGSANAHTITILNTGVTLTDGLMCWGRAIATNTGACTLQVNSLAAKSIYLPNNTAITSSHPGAITSNVVYIFLYHANGDRFFVLNPSGYMDQVTYDQEYPVGSTVLRRTTTTPTVPYGVTATWTRTTTEAFLRIEGGTPTTGGGDTATSSSGGAHTHTFSDTTSEPTNTGGSPAVGLRTEGVGHTHTVSGTTASNGAHTHTITADDLRFRSYAVWERTT